MKGLGRNSVEVRNRLAELHVMYDAALVVLASISSTFGTETWN